MTSWPTTSLPANWVLVAGRWYWTATSTTANPVTITLGSTSGTAYHQLSTWCVPNDRL